MWLSPLLPMSLTDFLSNLIEVIIAFFSGEAKGQMQETVKQSQAETQDYKDAKTIDDANRALSADDLDSKLR